MKVLDQREGRLPSTASVMTSLYWVEGSRRGRWSSAVAAVAEGFAKARGGDDFFGAAEVVVGGGGDQAVEIPFLGGGLAGLVPGQDLGLSFGQGSWTLWTRGCGRFIIQGSLSPERVSAPAEVPVTAHVVAEVGDDIFAASPPPGSSMYLEAAETTAVQREEKREVSEERLCAEPKGPERGGGGVSHASVRVSSRPAGRRCRTRRCRRRNAFRRAWCGVPKPA